MPTVEQIEEQVWALHKQDAHLEAADTLREGLRLHPENVSLQGLLVGALWCADAFGEAARAFREYLRLGGAEPYLLVSGAEAFYHVGMKAEALGVLKGLAEVPTMDADDGIRAGQLLSALTKEDALFEESCRVGLRLAEKTAAQHPTDAEARFGLGFWLHVGWQLNEEALPHVVEAVKNAPERWRFRMLLGHVLLSVNKHDEALEAWLPVPAGEIDDQDILRSLVRLLTERDRMAEAAVYLKRLYAMEDEAKAGPATPDIGTDGQATSAGS